MRVLPAPQAAAISVIMLSGGTIGAGVIACAETATDRVKPAIAINLIILHLLNRPITPTSQEGDGPAFVFK